MTRAVAALAVAALMAAGAAQAQDRGPAARQAAVDLAYVLGESHALRQACNGPDDQYWRDRMQAMIDAEQPDGPTKVRMAEAFNTGFAAGQSGFPDCDAAARAEAARIAARGAVLARRLGSP